MASSKIEMYNETQNRSTGRAPAGHAAGEFGLLSGQRFEIWRLQLGA
jgi:hypothetical protein